MKQVECKAAIRCEQGSDVAADLSQAEALCRAVAGRDLEGVLLYVVPQSTLPADYLGGDHHYAFTTPSLDLYLREHIRNWRDRGPCMVINDIGLAEDFDAEDLAYLTQITALHELVHILERPTLYADRTGEAPAKLQFEALVVADVSQRPALVDLPPFFGHGAGFIRIAIHLCHRAQLAGVPIVPSAICAGYRYGLSHASRYQRALGDEPARSLGLSFRDILTISPPAAFAALWHEDCSAFHQASSLQGVTT